MSAKQTPAKAPAVDVEALPAPEPGWAWAVHDGVEGAALLPLDSSWLRDGSGWQQVKSTPPGGGSTTDNPPTTED